MAEPSHDYHRGEMDIRDQKATWDIRFGGVWLTGLLAALTLMWTGLYPRAAELIEAISARDLPMGRAIRELEGRHG